MMEERKKPAVMLPMDADGRSIPLDTKVLYSGPDKVKVLSLSYYPVANYWSVDYYRSDFCGKRCLSTELRLSPSDSWDKLLGDLDRAGEGGPSDGECHYAGMAGESCDDCPFNFGADDPIDSCTSKILEDIARRIRALREMR